MTEVSEELPKIEGTALVEPHAHLSFVDQDARLAFHAMPVEESLLLTLKHARLYLIRGSQARKRTASRKVTSELRPGHCDQLAL